MLVEKSCKFNKFLDLFYLIDSYPIRWYLAEKRKAKCSSKLKCFLFINFIAKKEKETRARGNAATDH